MQKIEITGGQVGVFVNFLMMLRRTLLLWDVKKTLGQKELIESDDHRVPLPADVGVKGLTQGPRVGQVRGETGESISPVPPTF